MNKSLCSFFIIFLLAIFISKAQSGTKSYVKTAPLSYNEMDKQGFLPGATIPSKAQGSPMMVSKKLVSILDEVNVLGNWSSISSMDLGHFRDGAILNIRQYEYQPNKTPTLQYDYTYNSQTLPSSVLKKGWDTIGQRFLTQKTTTYNWDTVGRLKSWEIANSRKGFYFYDPSSINHDIYIYEPRRTGGPWFLDIKEVSKLDSNNRVIETDKQLNLSGQHPIEERITYHYDGALEKQRRYLKFDTTSLLWETIASSSYDYDPNKRPISRIDSSYNSSLNTLLPSLKVEIAYANNLGVTPLSHTYFDFDFRSSAWLPTERILHTLASQDRFRDIHTPYARYEPELFWSPDISMDHKLPIVDEHQLYQGGWASIKRRTYTYRSLSTNVESINGISVSVYPNPSSDYVIVDNPASTSISASLYNLHGSVCAEEHLSPQGQARIEMPEAPGLYLLKLETEQGMVSVRKLIKN